MAHSGPYNCEKGRNREKEDKKTSTFHTTRKLFRKKLKQFLNHYPLIIRFLRHFAVTLHEITRMRCGLSATASTNKRHKIQNNKRVIK